MMGKFKRIIWLWIECFKSMRNVNTFVPFLFYAILQVMLLYALNNFSQPLFSSLFVPMIRKFFGEPALHYPTYYLVLANLYSRLNIVLSGVIGILIIAIATHLFALNFRKEKTSFAQSLKTAMPKYGLLFLIWIIVSALVLGMIIGFPFILTKLLQPDYMIGRVIEIAGLLLGILLASIFSYTTVLIILDNQSFMKTLSNTVLIFKKNSVTTFLLVAIPTLFYFPISYIARRIDLIISKFSPEMIVVILGIGVIITFISSYFQTGAITRFYLLLNEKRNLEVHK